MTQPPGSAGGLGSPSSDDDPTGSPPVQPEPPAPMPADPASTVPRPGPAPYAQPGGYPPPPGQYPQPGQYPAAPPTYPGAPAFGLSPQEERTWGMFAHLSAIIAAFLALAFLGPLVIMLTQGTKSAFVRRHAVESLNFQLTLLLALVAGVVLSIVTLGLGLIVFLPLVVVGGILALVLTIVAGVKANNGEDYRYPINIRLVK